MKTYEMQLEGPSLLQGPCSNPRCENKNRFDVPLVFVSYKREQEGNLACNNPACWEAVAFELIKFHYVRSNQRAVRLVFYKTALVERTVEDCIVTISPERAIRNVRRSVQSLQAARSERLEDW